MSHEHQPGHFVLVPHSAGVHVMEQCPQCGENVRGSGRWVPREELRTLGVSIDLLPLRKKPNQQAWLFDGGNP